MPHLDVAHAAGFAYMTVLDPGGVLCGACMTSLLPIIIQAAAADIGTSGVVLLLECFACF